MVKSSPEETHDELPKSFKGWVTAVLGPILTMFRMRTASQQTRNDIEIESMRNRWSNGPEGSEFLEFQLQFPSIPKAFSDGRGAYTPPLSWKLDQHQKDAIQRGWEELLRQGEFQMLAEVWNGTDHEPVI